MIRPLINDPNLTHIGLDIETLSTSPRAYIASIAACVFDPFGDVVPKRKDVFSCCVGLNDKSQSKRHVDMTCNGTVWWWLNQSPEALRALQTPTTLAGYDDGFELSEMLGELTNYVIEMCYDFDYVMIWCRGNSFDPAILRDAYMELGLNQPWRHWNEMYLRVIETIALGRDIPKPERDIDEGSVAHDPVSDVLDQIRQTQHYLSNGWNQTHSISPTVKHLSENGKGDSEDQFHDGFLDKPKKDLAGQSTVDVIKSRMLINETPDPTVGILGVQTDPPIALGKNSADDEEIPF